MTTVQNISTSALLVEVAIGCWTARLLDKGVTQEVIENKSAGSTQAIRANKSLMAGRTELKEIEQIAGAVRTFVYENSMPWSNAGLRLLPTIKFMEFDARIKQFEQEFYNKVQDFIAIYPSLITGQAMALGALFKRSDFPLPETLASKFTFTVGYMPVPSSGDWRVDTEVEAQQALKDQLDKLAQDRLEAALASVWAKLGEHLKRMATQLGTKIVNGKEVGGKLYDSLLDSGWDLVNNIKAMNIVNDPVMEEARKELERAITGVTIEELRKNADIRQDVQKDVQAILNKFSWS